MKFFSEGVNVVWDKERKKALCEFDPKTYELETKDYYICSKLIELGYKHEGKMPTQPKETGKENEK